jgi:ATP-dependent DNA helicase RecG
VNRSGADWLATPLQFVKGVGPRRAADLERVGLLTIEDFLFRFPLRYENRASLMPIAKLRPGTTATIDAEVVSAGIRPTRRPGFRIFEVIVRDETGPARAAFPNQAFLKDVFKPGQQVVLYGTVEFRGSGGLQFTNPEYEIIRGDSDDEDSSVHTGRIVPIYEKAGSMTPRIQRTMVHRLLSEMPLEIPDPLPESIRTRRSLLDRRSALQASHFPPPDADMDVLNTGRSEAQQRLIFEEFFLFQAGLVLRKRQQAAHRKARAVVVDDRVRESARKTLPFRLTAGQRQALKEIVEDMQRPEPMNRLLQGDVGAGKTVVALIAAVVAMESGFQVAFMAPTGDPGGSALPDDSPHARAVPVSRRVAHGKRWCGAPARGHLGAREWRGPSGRRHARAGRAGRGVPRTRTRGDRRAASVWRGSAGGVAHEGLESRRARHDRHTESRELSR